MTTSWPLEQHDLDGLNAVLGTEQMIRPLLQKCKDCGLPVDAEISTLNTQLDHARRLKAGFFPNEH